MSYTDPGTKIAKVTDFSVTFTSVTPVALDSHACKRMLVSAYSTNSSGVNIGSETSQNTILAAGDRVEMFVDRSDYVYAYGASGDTISALLFNR